MNQFEQELNKTMSQGIPEHQDGFWNNLEESLSKHRSIPASSQFNSESNQESNSESSSDSSGAFDDDSLDLARPNVVDIAPLTGNESDTKTRWPKRFGFIATAACLIVGLGFAVPMLSQSSDSVQLASGPPIDYTQLRFETDIDPAQRPQLVQVSNESAQRLIIDPSQSVSISPSQKLYPTAISADQKLVLYRVGDRIFLMEADGTPKQETAKELPDDRLSAIPKSELRPANSAFSTAGSVVAIPHPDGVVLWDYENSTTVVVSICPGIACTFNSQDRFGGEAWFNEDGTVLHFDLVNPVTGEQTSAGFVFTPDTTTVDATFNPDDEEIPGVLSDE